MGCISGTYVVLEHVRSGGFWGDAVYVSSGWSVGASECNPETTGGLSSIPLLLGEAIGKFPDDIWTGCENRSTVFVAMKRLMCEQRDSGLLYTVYTLSHKPFCHRHRMQPLYIQHRRFTVTPIALDLYSAKTSSRVDVHPWMNTWTITKTTFVC